MDDKIVGCTNTIVYNNTLYCNNIVSNLLCCNNNKAISIVSNIFWYALYRNLLSSNRSTITNTSFMCNVTEILILYTYNLVFFCVNEIPKRQPLPIDVDFAHVVTNKLMIGKFDVFVTFKTYICNAEGIQLYRSSTTISCIIAYFKEYT